MHAGQGTYESRGVLGSVGNDGDIREALAIKSITECSNSAIHHVRGSYNVSSSASLAESLSAELVHGVVVHDASLHMECENVTCMGYIYLVGIVKFSRGDWPHTVTCSREILW